MAKYEINKTFRNDMNYVATVEADYYEQQGEFFVFKRRSDGAQVSTVAAKLIHSIDLAEEPSSK